MHARRLQLRRGCVAAVTILALLGATPGAAFAETPPLWSVWVDQVAKRESKPEIPFAILFSLPPMLVVTPFWLGNLAVDKAKGGDDE